MRWMLSNSDGEKDAVLTLAVCGFCVVLLKLLCQGVSLTVFGKLISLGSIDAGSIAAVLTPTLGAYCARRMTDRKHEVDMTKAIKNESIV